MTTDVQPRHPFAITSKLPPSFGYSKAFASGALRWELNTSTTSSTGGGRLADSAIRSLVADLGRYTKEGESVEARQVQLTSLYTGHYDAPHTLLLLNFFLEGSCKTGMTKAEAIGLLVGNGVPFIPWAILSEHFAAGAKLLKAKATLPKLNWAAPYKAFCDAFVTPQVPVPLPLAEDEEAKSVRLAKIFDYWQSALSTHNSDVAPAKQVQFSDKELSSFTGSQFSDSANGTPHVSKSSSMEGSLKAKLALIQPSLKERAAKIARAKELRQELHDLEGSSDEEQKAPRPSKKQKQRKGSDSDSDSESGSISALDSFIKNMKLKIEKSEYIDFASLSTPRLHEIKMLNSSSSKISRIHANLSFRQFLSEADVKTLSEDLAAIFDGFLFHYLQMVSESHLPDPIKTIFDRIRWWQWVSSNFVGNPAAQVMYIKHFMVEYHQAEFWEPVAKNSYTLVARCKDTCFTPPFSAPKPPAYPKSGKSTTPGGTPKGGKGGKKNDYTPAQVAKLVAFKSRFPNICLSRVIKGRNCPGESKHVPCKYTHNCAWCSSSSCRATCSAAEPF